MPMLVNFILMVLMGMIVRAMIAGMVMSMNLKVAGMLMRMFVLMQVLMFVQMHMLMGMFLLSMPVLMFMGMTVFVIVEMQVFVIAFHECPPSMAKNGRLAAGEIGRFAILAAFFISQLSCRRPIYQQGIFIA